MHRLINAVVSYTILNRARDHVLHTKDHLRVNSVASKVILDVPSLWTARAAPYWWSNNFLRCGMTSRTGLLKSMRHEQEGQFSIQSTALEPLPVRGW